MSEPDVISKCPMCDQMLLPGSKFCGECGFALTSAGPRTAPAKPKWYQNFWVLLFMIFFVLGPFAIPLIWKHPTMSRNTKWVLTAVALGYTLMMLVMVAKLVAVVQTSLESFNNSLQAY